MLVSFMNTGLSREKFKSLIQEAVEPNMTKATKLFFNKFSVY